MTTPKTVKSLLDGSPVEALPQTIKSHITRALTFESDVIPIIFREVAILKAKVEELESLLEIMGEPAILNRAAGNKKAATNGGGRK